MAKAKTKTKPKAKPVPKKSSPVAKAKPAEKAAKRRPAPLQKVKAAKAKSGAPARMSWLDAKSGEPLIHQYTERLNTFLEAMADGRVDSSEIEQQGKRLTRLLKQIEPKLTNALHSEVTELLCELSAYNIMQTVHELASAAPKTKFRG